jgi:signal transduction histidine kinase
MADVQSQRIAALETELAAVRAEMQDFTYTVSHDLRAPLRHIVSYVQLVEEDAAHLLSDEVRGFLGVISDSAQHMGVLMDALLALSRVGSVAVQPATVPLQTAVQAALATVAPKYPQRTVLWDIQPEMPAVHADATLLHTALEQVLDNALKFTAQREQAHVTVHAVCAPEFGLVTLTVQDNGVGFQATQQARLFKPFQRLHTTKQFAGLGMGLALTRRIVERMGGSATIAGELDQGCTARLILPAATR